MATKKKSIDSGMMLVISYIVMFVVNAIIILFANALFPDNIVLGTENINTVWTIIYAVGFLTLVCTFVIPFAHYFENERGKMLTSQEWMILYFAVNFVTVWYISRFADHVGLGISTWLVALGLAAALDIAQGVAMMLVEHVRKSL